MRYGTLKIDQMGRYIVKVGMIKQDQATRRSHEKEICLVLEPDASALT